MKASAGGYARAESVGHALELLTASDGQGRVLAGGQSLIAAMNMRLSNGDMLVDISNISDLSGVTLDGDTLRIGALTRHAQVGSDPHVKAQAPLLTTAVGHIAHAAIRNRGTIGGALAHADPAAEFPACALALGATIHVEGPDGVRSIPAEDFFEEVFTTALNEDEILTSITVPITEPDEVQVLEEVVRRSGDYAMVGLCLVKRAAGHRISLFSVGPKPILATSSMAALDGGDLDAAVAALASEMDPPSDTQASAAYRRHLAGVLLRRAFARLEGEAA
ncbi:xanthine dehydrogenase family protein subunit M [Roseobacter sp. HKCCD9010]|uniref:FAD binding domain-containing protein n=1 Tax=unclassified Roseobacter TaxID=196798 RepID=UPI001491D8F1|nr:MULTISPECIES: xanthine dehydrogenase family protein subunit M [unclassified Roseobacter]MBF9052069.1 xanthine dehydrogenase family protein subunit M [Rhodobacterales bacterium HKCCD4356]NNV13991.1 xanthine dehydrogenase family protein subunit M [Roseobacter sp. HKCCD7357]NNV18232.1 xanthine dehydrogenase family protein subunit M [Roseobacter sp. HKCCD8768]NNV27690.1 xanthine dehydrogenase family protein subunit M [Roseobacter sp. HKCCD8192]NNV31933.1 xanthine dehydrogenase family protein su